MTFRLRSLAIFNGVKLLIIDFRFVAGSGFEFRSICLVPRAVVEHAAGQYRLALHRSIQRKARIQGLGFTSFDV